MTDFIGLNAELRRDQEKAMAVKTIREIADRLVVRDQVFGAYEF